MNKQRSSSDRSKKVSGKEAHPGQKGFKKFFKKDAEAERGKGGATARKSSGKEKGRYRSSGEEEKPSRNTEGRKPFGRDKARPSENDKARTRPARPDRYAHAFGKLDDEELAARQRKQQARQEQGEDKDTVSFSKSLDKWEQETPNEEREQKGKSFADRRESRQPRHNKKDRFKRNFDKENDYEKAYSARPDGRMSRKKAAETADDEAYAEKAVPDKMPLNKYIAHCDVCSRREAVTLIKDGKVKVNGAVVTEPGYKVTGSEEITLNDKKLTVQKNLVYILLNKPKGYITTTDDPKGRKTVMDIVQDHIDERVFPIGRLDRNTTGLLLLTNDGELAQKLSHPKYEVRKVYQVKLNKAVTKADFDRIAEGLTLEDGPVKVDAIEYLDSKDEIGLEIHSGKNRIVRRIFESLGYEVEKLDRVMYAGLTKKNILRGKWRFLTKQEVINLKHFR